jgi:hypothetical protein
MNVVEWAWDKPCEATTPGPVRLGSHYHLPLTVRGRRLWP